MKFCWGLCLLSFFASTSLTVHAADTVPANEPTNATSDGNGWMSRWLNHVTEIQAAQPHWVTPLVTVTPRLEQEFRTDYVDQAGLPNGKELTNYGNGKGLELIPFDPVEVIINVPPYLVHHNPKIDNGFGDFSALVKYRILSANEKEGDYILSVFLGVSIPTAQDGNGTAATVYSPSISGGKGFGDFDVQSTFGLTIPDVSQKGTTIKWDTAFQYHIQRLFWPEVEFNYFHYTGGADVGKDQLFITPGLVLGRIPLQDRLGLTLGAGMQIAASSYHKYDHAWVLTARLPF